MTNLTGSERAVVVLSLMWLLGTPDHDLLTVSDNATPEDVTQLRNKAQALVKRLREETCV